ncbi:MAG: hypothetical protein LBK99_01970 [Opitutaceae bacterium]|jgi:predicted GH43/DUF377 family glycosyl hydrolase|nr:hypothetical protein [Opitutaceae bacterium]
MFRKPTLLARHAKNPVIKPADFPGAADTCIGLAEGNLDAIPDACLKGE